MESSSHHVGSFIVVHTLGWWPAGLVALCHVGSLFPRPGIEPVSPPFLGRLSTTGLPGKIPEVTCNVKVNVTSQKC